MIVLNYGIFLSVIVLYTQNYKYTVARDMAKSLQMDYCDNAMQWLSNISKKLRRKVKRKSSSK